METLHAFGMVVLLFKMTSRCDAEVFTSSAKMSDLAVLEGMVMDAVREKIRLDTLLLEHRSRELAAGDLGKDVANHPNGAYLTINTFLHTWQHVIETYPDFHELSNYHKALLLTQDDLHGSLSAILRLQKVYAFPVDEAYAGNYSGYLGPPLSPLDAYNIGRQGFEDGLMDLAISWLELAVRKGREGNWFGAGSPAMTQAEGMTSEEGVTPDDASDWMTQEEIVADTLGLLGRAYLYAGNVEKATEAYKESVSYSNATAGGDVTELGKELTDKPPTGFSREPWHQNMSELCSRHKHHTVAKIRSFHICRYKRGVTTPYVNYKEEIVSLVPYVSLIYDVISDTEIEAVKTFAKSKMQRSRVEDTAAGSAVTFARTSHHCWIADADLSLASRLSSRITDVTGLDTTQRLPHGPSSAEPLQVVNYGLGGHYNTHFDPLIQTPTKPPLMHAGARIATFLLYLNDVEKGGHTVFVNAGISVAPVKGMALLWYNYNPAMKLEQQTLHAGCPVLKGHKWIANKWVWTYGNTFRRPCGPSPQSTQLDVEEMTYSRHVRF